MYDIHLNFMLISVVFSCCVKNHKESTNQSCESRPAVQMKPEELNLDSQFVFNDLKAEIFIKCVSVKTCIM